MKPTSPLVILTLLTLSACGMQALPTSPSTPTLVASSSPLPSATPSATPTATPTLGIGSSQVSPLDGMLLLYVPEGSFLMGSEQGYGDEEPVHTVVLPAFWIDQTEVTNGMYAGCVDAGACARPRQRDSNTVNFYFGYEPYLDFPVIKISWQDASNYCTWVGRRLPTEAEWEKAARGTDGRSYPWGETLPDQTRANCNHFTPDTTRVGSYPGGVSPYGVLDMAGNVLEWTADWYGRTYYASSPELSPTGPQSGERRVIRGGSWTTTLNGMRVSYRFVQEPASPSFEIGIRCVADPQP